MSIITIGAIELKEKRSIIVTTEGRRLGVWTDKMGPFNFQVGGTFEVETTEKNIDGRILTNIVQAKQATAAMVASQPREPFVSGAYRPSNAHSKDEQIWVQGLLQALIKAGEVKNDKTQLWTTTQTLRGLWKHTFGSVDPTAGMQAAE